MKKPITDEKFYIIDIPMDMDKRKSLLRFLGEDDIRDDRISRNMVAGVLSYYVNKYVFNCIKENYHTVITYNDLMTNYLPKDTVLNNAVDEVIKEVSKNEDKINKVKNPNATHYELWNGFEAIDIIKNTLSKDEYIGYLKGNILKYQLRLGKKTTDYEGVSKDLEKLKDYQNELNEYWIL